MRSAVENLKGKERRGSTGSIEDFRKRKREMSGESKGDKEDIFKRSNRIQRSPQRGSDKEGDRWLR